jgi:hypothetical protein
MASLLHRRITPRALNELIAEAPVTPATLTPEHQASFAARLKAVPHEGQRRLDAWLVEQAATTSSPFHWSPLTAKRTIALGALRVMQHHATLASAVQAEIDNQLMRVVSGRARSGSMAWWLANSSETVRQLVAVEATQAALQIKEVSLMLDGIAFVPAADAYYDVPGARTTLRGRRDIVVPSTEGRVLLRLRNGAPGRSAGPGLRAELFVDAISDLSGASAQRIIGLWPDAGVMLSVDGTMENLRRGARDFVRSAVVQHRQALQIAA